MGIENEKHDLEELKELMNAVEMKALDMSLSGTDFVISDRLDKDFEGQTLVEYLDDLFEPIYSEAIHRIGQLKD